MLACVRASAQAGGKTPGAGGGTRGTGGMGIAQRLAGRGKSAGGLRGDGGGGERGGGDTPPRTAESGPDGGAGESEGGEGGEADVVPDLPPSWVPKLVVPRDAFDMRCPRVRCVR